MVLRTFVLKNSWWKIRATKWPFAWGGGGAEMLFGQVPFKCVSFFGEKCKLNLNLFLSTTFVGAHRMQPLRELRPVFGKDQCNFQCNNQCNSPSASLSATPSATLSASSSLLLPTISKPLHFPIAVASCTMASDYLRFLLLPTATGGNKTSSRILSEITRVWGEKTVRERKKLQPEISGLLTERKNGK